MTSRLLRTVVVLACASLVLSACAGKSTNSSGDAGGGPRTSASASAAASGSSLAKSDEGLPGTVEGDDATSDGSGTGGAPAKTASQSTPPRPGIYTYRQSGTISGGGQVHEVPETGTLEVEAATKVSGGLRSAQTRSLDEGQDVEQVFLFTKNEVFLQQIGAQGFSCVLRPALLTVEIPLKVGDKWSDTATCSANGQTMTITLRAKVLRTEKRKVGSDTVNTFVLDMTTKTEGAGFSQVQDATTWLSPAHRLSVRSVTNTQTTSPFGNGTSKYVEQLVSLDPK